MEPSIKERIYTFLRERTRYFELLSDPFTNEEEKYTLIRGAVQSGKTRILYANALWNTCIQGRTTVVLLRNITDDRNQFCRGWKRFCEEVHDVAGKEFKSSFPMSVQYMGDVRRKKKDGQLVHHEAVHSLLTSTTGGVVVCLANVDQLSKWNQCWQESGGFQDYIVQIDEMDQLLFSEGEQVSPQLETLLENASHVYGISATLFETWEDLKTRFRTSRVFYLPPPKGYQGIGDLRHRPIEKWESKETMDASLFRFVNEFVQTPVTTHPCIGLIKTERLILQQEALLEKLARLYPSLTIMTYNGLQCQLYDAGFEETPLCISMMGHRRKSQWKKGTHVFSHGSPVYLLQYMKDNGNVTRFPRILIISYQVVGRGLNIVSEDFEWHLTHMFYRPKENTNVTTMMQSMRLCGVYKDALPLTLYMEQRHYENMIKGYLLQEDLFQRISNQKTSQTLPLWFSQQTVYDQKVPKARLYKNRRFSGNVTKTWTKDPGFPWTLYRDTIGRAKERDTVDVQENKIEGVDLNKLRKWIESETLVGRMIRFLVDQDKPVSWSIVKAGVGYDRSEQQFKNNVDNGSSVKSQYGRLWIVRHSYQEIELNPKMKKFLSTIK